MCETLHLEPITVIHLGPWTTANKLHEWYEQRLEEKGLVIISKNALEDITNDAIKWRTNGD